MNSAEKRQFVFNHGWTRMNTDKKLVQRRGAENGGNRKEEIHSALFRVLCVQFAIQKSMFIRG
jgi:hypothetical protein